MNESKWIISKWLREGELKGEIRGEIRGELKGEKRGELKGELKRGRETAHEMFVDGENIFKIRKYSKLPDEDLADVLRELPKEIQTKYNLITN